MKTCRILCALGLILALAACQKENQRIQTNGRSLKGIWELRVVNGGMLAYPPPILPGNGDQWRFSETEYGKYYKDTLYRTGIYTIGRGTGTDPNTQRTIDQFIFDQVPSESFELRDDTLRMYYGPIAADGIIMMYTKISDQF